MPIKNITDTRRTKAWEGEIPVSFLYTLGIAGEKFFREVKDNARFLGTKCGACDVVHIPPKIFCPLCFGELSEWVEVKNEAELLSWSSVHIDGKGKRLKEPQIVGLVRLKGTEGALVHRLVGITEKTAKIGMRLRAKFRPERKGGMQDIEGFEKA